MKQKIKNKAQSKNYSSQVKHLTGYNHTSEQDIFENLQGSNEEQSNNTNNLKPIGQKKRKIKNFFKEHIFETIISVLCTIAISITAWICVNTIELKEKVAVFEYRINQIQTNIETLDDTVVDKEFLYQELKILKLELQSATAQSLSTIELRISLLEEQIKNK